VRSSRLGGRLGRGLRSAPLANDAHFKADISQRLWSAMRVWSAPGDGRALPTRRAKEGVLLSPLGSLTTMLDRQTKRLLGIVVAFAVLLALACVLWVVSGTDVTEGDVIIIAVGVIATVLLAGGLMAAMFFSDRAGYDR
jgi:hypothetical protein